MVKENPQTPTKTFFWLVENPTNICLLSALEMEPARIHSRARWLCDRHVSLTCKQDICLKRSLNINFNSRFYEKKIFFFFPLHFTSVCCHKSLGRESVQLALLLRPRWKRSVYLFPSEMFSSSIFCHSLTGTCFPWYVEGPTLYSKPFVWPLISGFNTCTCAHTISIISHWQLATRGAIMSGIF